MEEWRPIRGWDDLYEVSDAGRVRNIRTGRILHPNRMSNGYEKVSLKHINTVGRSGYQVTVHRLVAEAFHGPRPSRRHDVDHLNGCKTDNRAANLEWVTRRENTRRAFALGLSRAPIAPPNQGELHPSARLTATQVVSIMHDPRPQRIIAPEYGVSRSLVGLIKQGKRWRHLSE